MPAPSRPLPKVTPETDHFWAGTRSGELRLQRCSSCSHSYFPPRPFCPDCGSRDVEVYAASGKATLHSYVINHRPHPSGHEPWQEPYAIALVQLAEGPRMMANITGCAQTPEALELDMPLQVDFERVTDDITLAQFAPAAGGEQ